MGDNNRKSVIQQKQKKRIRIQQNVITTLCLACMVFCVGWSVYAAETGNTLPTDNSVNDTGSDSGKNDTQSKAAEDNTSSQKEESSSKEESSQTDSEKSSSESSKKESSSSQDESSSKKDDSSSKEDSSSKSDTPRNTRELVDTKDDLSDALFIGDSRTVGMRNSSDKPKATYYCAVGLHIDTVLTSSEVSLENGKTGSVLSALKARKFKRIYLNFGVNELGWPYPEVFKEKYAQVISQIKALQPEAVIYAVSILPVTASRDAQGDSVNNTNVKKFNEYIKQAAKENGVKYIDCTPAVADKNGLLPEDASTDGVHMIAQYCIYWQNYIINNT